MPDNNEIIWPLIGKSINEQLDWLCERHVEMLRALELCSVALRAQMGNWHEDEWPTTIFWEPYKAVLKAMNKATGEEP